MAAVLDRLAPWCNQIPGVVLAGCQVWKIVLGVEDLVTVVIIVAGITLTVCVAVELVGVVGRGAIVWRPGACRAGRSLRC